MSMVFKDRNRFFTTSVYGLVSMLEEYSSKLYGTSDSHEKWSLVSSVELVDGIKSDCVTLSCRGIYIKFACIYGELFPIDLENIDYATIKRTTKVVEDCIGNLSDLNRPIHKIEGWLCNGHTVRCVKVYESVDERGAVDILLE